MSNSELNHLITMINQIADNVAINDSSEAVVSKVANHISRFWARSMKEQIIAYAENDGEQLRPAAREALTLL